MLGSWESKGLMLRVVRNPIDGGNLLGKGMLIYNQAPQHQTLHPVEAGELCVAMWMGDGRLFSEDWSDVVHDSMHENGFLERVFVPSLLKSPPMRRYVTQKQHIALERAGADIPGLVIV